MLAKDAEGRYVIFTDQPEGNAYSIIATVVEMLRQIHGDTANEIIDKYREEAQAGDYENLKKVSLEAVPGLLTFEVSDNFEIVAERK